MIRYVDPFTGSHIEYADHMLEIGAAKLYDDGKKVDPLKELIRSSMVSESNQLDHR